MQWAFKHYTFQNEHNKLFRMSSDSRSFVSTTRNFLILKQANNDTKYLLSEGILKGKNDTILLRG